MAGILPCGLSIRDLYDCDAVFWADYGHWTKMGEVRSGERLLAAHPELVE
jgi:hypothetical protein